jgi:hypothetical protein
VDGVALDEPYVNELTYKQVILWDR